MPSWIRQSAMSRPPARSFGESRRETCFQDWIMHSDSGPRGLHRERRMSARK